MRSSLGLAGYYRALIRDFASIGSPLTRLFKKRMSLIWYNIQQTSFHRLQHALIHAPVLAFLDYSLPFTILTDASALVTAVLMQQTESSCPQVIAYASRTVNGADSRYSVTHLEAQALVWDIRNFRDIIYVYQLTVYNDHAALLHLLKGKNLSGHFAR